MAVVWHFTRPGVPLRAIVLSLAALLIPVLQTLFWPGPATEAEPLIWLVALVPAFLLAYYRGREGAATALAVGMVFLTLTHVLMVVLGKPIASWQVLFGVTAALIAISLATGWISELLHRDRAKAETLALTDDLTGIWNRRRARMFLESTFDQAVKGGETRFAVVLFDLDSFKSFNDMHGHEAGDIALQHFAGTLRQTTRLSDLSARYGGEEFVTVLSSCDEKGALVFVERVRRALKSADSHLPNLTACAGIACFDPGMNSPNDVMIAADKALYAAKKNGHDHVCIHERAAA
jgi:diguanylate cyclase (GGDEF)-like protein